jgi:indolepyruvate ferredoxin oxidoreductase beta subunit
MIHNIIVTGLGGQGILTLSKVLRQGLVTTHSKLSGYDNRGGAQRFGHVHAVIRASDETAEMPLALDFPAGDCHLLFSLEGTEALQFLKKTGQNTLLLLDRFTIPPTNIRREGKKWYTVDDTITYFTERGATVIVDDFRKKAEQQTGDSRNANFLMLQQACKKLDWLDFNNFSQLIPQKVLRQFSTNCQESE